MDTDEIVKYVLQRTDGKFYSKHSKASLCWDFVDSFEDAYLFNSEDNAKIRARLPIAGKDTKIRKVILSLV